MNPSPGGSLYGLPPMAGLGSVADMCRPGLSVDACVDRLKRYHYVLQRMWRILLSRLPSEPVYELKMAWSLHAHLAAEHVTAIRERVAEMRHPPLGLEKVPHLGLQRMLDELDAAPTPVDLIQGMYERVLPELKSALVAHLAETNALADAPTCRMLRFALLELEDMIQWGKQAMASGLPDHQPPQGGREWMDLLETCLKSAGGLSGTLPVESRPAVPSAHFAAQPVPATGQNRRSPQRDERFPDPYNMGVHAEAFLYDPKYPPSAKTLMMYFKRLREIDVPEMMATILTGVEGKPWEFYRDLTRQLWDEARHAMMGEVGFASLGIDWPRLVMVNFTWSKGLNEQLTPQERHAVLWFIEQGLMNKTGKRFEWEVGTASGDPLSALFQDYDWADEVLHARIGRDWYVRDFDNDPHRAAEYGSACWSKVVSGWEEFRKQGLTAHRNWWPELYQEFCRLRNEAPDPEVEAFATTYQETRADLQRIAASA